MERINCYFETSSLRGRDSTGPTDFNTQLDTWLPMVNTRTVRASKGRPVGLLEADWTAMLALPPQAPAVGLRVRIRLPGDYNVRVFGNDDSVNPVAIGRMVDAAAELGQAWVHLGAGWSSSTQTPADRQTTRPERLGGRLIN